MQIFIAPCGRVPYLIKTFWLEPRLAKDASLSPSARQPCDWFQPLRVKLAVDLLKSEGFAGGGGGGASRLYQLGRQMSHCHPNRPK